MKTQHVQINIPLSFNQIIEIVRQLSFPEKQQLTEFLWTEPEMGELVISEGHKKIVRDRIKKLEENQGEYLSWEDVERKMATR